MSCLSDDVIGEVGSWCHCFELRKLLVCRQWSRVLRESIFDQIDQPGEKNGSLLRDTQNFWVNGVMKRAVRHNQWKAGSEVCRMRDLGVISWVHWVCWFWRHPMVTLKPGHLSMGSLRDLFAAEERQSRRVPIWWMVREQGMASDLLKFKKREAGDQFQKLALHQAILNGDVSTARILKEEDQLDSERWFGRKIKGLLLRLLLKGQKIPMVEWIWTEVSPDSRKWLGRWPRKGKMKDVRTNMTRGVFDPIGVGWDFVLRVFPLELQATEKGKTKKVQLAVMDQGNYSLSRCLNIWMALYRQAIGDCTRPSDCFVPEDQNAMDDQEEKLMRFFEIHVMGRLRELDELIALISVMFRFWSGRNTAFPRLTRHLLHLMTEADEKTGHLGFSEACELASSSSFSSCFGEDEAISDLMLLWSKLIDPNAIISGRRDFFGSQQVLRCLSLPHQLSEKAFRICCWSVGRLIKRKWRHSSTFSVDLLEALMAGCTEHWTISNEKSNHEGSLPYLLGKIQYLVQLSPEAQQWWENHPLNRLNDHEKSDHLSWQGPSQSCWLCCYNNPIHGVVPTTRRAESLRILRKKFPFLTCDCALIRLLDYFARELGTHPVLQPQLTDQVSSLVDELCEPTQRAFRQLKRPAKLSFRRTLWGLLCRLISFGDPCHRIVQRVLDLFSQHLGIPKKITWHESLWHCAFRSNSTWMVRLVGQCLDQSPFISISPRSCALILHFNTHRIHPDPTWFHCLQFTPLRNSWVFNTQTAEGLDDRFQRWTRWVTLEKKDHFGLRFKRQARILRDTRHKNSLRQTRRSSFEKDLISNLIS